ncbi:hypothetical protein EON63_07860 [archaeon]|nr:MAG: hypothetical protein EON63_07860 [archaeon]
MEVAMVWVWMLVNKSDMIRWCVKDSINHNPKIRFYQFRLYLLIQNNYPISRTLTLPKVINMDFIHLPSPYTIHHTPRHKNNKIL